MFIVSARELYAHHRTLRNSFSVGVFAPLLVEFCSWFLSSLISCTFRFGKLLVRLLIATRSKKCLKMEQQFSLPLLQWLLMMDQTASASKNNQRIAREIRFQPFLFSCLDPFWKRTIFIHYCWFVCWILNTLKVLVFTLVATDWTRV